MLDGDTVFSTWWGDSFFTYSWGHNCILGIQDIYGLVFAINRHGACGDVALSDRLFLANVVSQLADSAGGHGEVLA